MIGVDFIRLEPEQKELFVRLVEAYRSVPRPERRAFMLIRTMSGTTLLHPALPQNFAVLDSDLDTLQENGLLRVNFGSRGTPRYDVTPHGLEYYTYLKTQVSGVAESAEESIRAFVNVGQLEAIAPGAYSSWALAAEQLARGDSGPRLSEIGHHCREALQHFAQALVDRYKLTDANPDPTKTVDRIRAIIRARVESKATSAFVEALLNYWGTTSDLVQRQEHGALKESEELQWKDARRVVFGVLYVMYEVVEAVEDS